MSKKPKTVSSFVNYIDESGDEVFVFREEDSGTRDALYFRTSTVHSIQEPQ